MKRILITGKNSYIGNKFEEWVKDDENYKIDKISMRYSSWKEEDFSIYDTIFHVAGIAHVSTSSDMEDKYYKVNRDLTIKAAKKAKAEGVRQFIFLSSIIVYGDSAPIGQKKIINKETIPNPSNFYGNSKLQAEEGILALQDDKFKIVILRPPMVYGKGSQGNYIKLSKAAQKLPIFPNIDNERSMIHIDNLCEFTKLMIENEERGTFFPQNKEYVKTSDMVRLISEVHNKNLKLTKIFNGIIRLMGARIGIVNKVFGNLVYHKSLSDYTYNYTIYKFEKTIFRTEND